MSFYKHHGRQSHKHCSKYAEEEEEKNATILESLPSNSCRVMGNTQAEKFIKMKLFCMGYASLRVCTWLAAVHFTL